MARREISRDLVGGSWEAVSPQTFRYTFPTLDQATGYVESAGLGLFDQIFGIVRVRFRDVERVILTPRRGWDRLSAQTKRDYQGSSQAQAEAAYHDMTVPEWYERAPDLKAFRRHTRGRVGSEGTTAFDEEFQVFISRKYKGLAPGTAEQMSQSVHAAWAARQRAQADLLSEQYGFGES
jgi:hypothetical protein